MPACPLPLDLHSCEQVQPTPPLACCQVRKWRRDLHTYDPAPEGAEASQPLLAEANPLGQGPPPTQQQWQQPWGQQQVQLPRAQEPQPQHQRQHQRHKPPQQQQPRQGGQHEGAGRHRSGARDPKQGRGFGGFGGSGNGHGAGSRSGHRQPAQAGQRVTPSKRQHSGAGGSGIVAGSISASEQRGTPSKRRRSNEMQVRLAVLPVVNLCICS